MFVLTKEQNISLRYSVHVPNKTKIAEYQQFKHILSKVLLCSSNIIFVKFTALKSKIFLLHVYYHNRYLHVHVLYM